jgi:hypothetical protein
MLNTRVSHPFDGASHCDYGTVVVAPKEYLPKVKSPANRPEGEPTDKLTGELTNEKGGILKGRRLFVPQWRVSAR